MVKLNEATEITSLADGDLLAVIPSEATAGDAEAAAYLPEGITKANLGSQVAAEIAAVRWRGDYDAATTYSRLDMVSHIGGLWIHVGATATTGTAPVIGGNSTWTSFRGPAGPSGLQGPQGLRGFVGPQGDPGLRGPRGDQGPPGADGDDGADGADGAPGADGVDGAPGVDGADGRSTFQGVWSADATYHQGDQVLDAQTRGWQYTQANPGNTSASPTAGNVWQSTRGETGQRGQQGPQGLPGTPGTPGADGAQGPAGPAAAGNPTPRDFLGATDLAHGVNGLVLNAANWKAYDYLNIVIVEESASEATPNRVHNLTGSMLDVGFLKATTPADATAYGTMVNTEVCSFRGETTTASNRYFYLARTATDEENKLRLSANAAINVSSGTTQVIEVRGLRVGASNFKGPFDATKAYGQGDIVFSASNMWIALRDVAASTTAPAEGDNWAQLNGGAGGGTADLTHAFRPAVAGAIGDVLAAGPGWHVVGPGTGNLPSGVVVGAGEAAIKVEATDQSGGEHRVITLYVVNRQVSGSATVRQVWQTLQDGPSYDSDAFSPWRRIDNPLNEAILGLTPTTLSLRKRLADGSETTQLVNVPTQLAGQAHFVDAAWTGTTLRITLKDILNQAINPPADAELILPALTQAQWDRTAENPDTYLTSEALLSPSKLTAVITRNRPQGIDSVAEGGENVAVYYGWNPRQLHLAARAALPAITAASVTSGTDSTTLKSVTDAALKASIEALAPASSGGGGGFTFERIGNNEGNAIRNSRAIIIVANNWADYSRFQIIVRTSGAGSFVTQFFPITRTNANDRVSRSVTSPPSNHGYARIEDTTGEFWAIIAPVVDSDDSSNDAEDELMLYLSGELDNSSTSIEIWALSTSASEVVNEAAPFITYGLLNAPAIDGRYSGATIYGSATDTRIANSYNRRKMQWSPIYASSNSGNGLPSAAGLTWHTGGRDGVDAEEGETATGDLLDGSVFSLDGTWRIKVNLTIDNLENASTRIELSIRKVNATATNDDVAWFTEAAEFGGGGQLSHAGSSVPTDQRLHSSAVSAQLETPLLSFASTDRYYVSFKMSRTDRDQTWRILNATLELTKRG